MAADSELRRRYPGKPIAPLRSAEPRVPDDDQITTARAEAEPAKTPDWVTQLAEQRRAFQDKLEERQNVMIPAEDPDYGFLGQAWPWQQRDSDAILQPPKPEIRPFSGIERPTGWEIPEPEAGGLTPARRKGNAMDFEVIARQTAVGQQKCDDPGCHTAAGQEECDDPDCACHPGTGQPQPGDGAAEVTMTEVYDIDIPWGHHPSGW